MSKKDDSLKIGRRGFLLGLGGAAVALPFLESMHIPQRASASPDERRRFAVFVRSGNGVQQSWSDEPESFWPRMTGALTVASMRDENGDRATSELADFASRLNLLKGVRRPFGTPACGHAESLPQCLTGAQNTGGVSNEPLSLGQSADWRITEELMPSGYEPMTLMAGPGRAYIAEGLSWRAPRERTPADRSPATVYMRLMGLSGMPPEIQARIAERRNSVNDLVRDELNTLMGSSALSSRDQMRLTQHFEAIRDTELDVMCDVPPELMMAIDGIDNPESNDVRPEVVRQHMSLIALAINCGQIRAATLQIGEGNDQTQYEYAGSRLPRFHWISHRIYSDGSEGEPIPDALTLHHQVDRIQLRLFHHLLSQLDSYDSPWGGSLLDDGVSVWMNELSAGPPHGGLNVPWILAGSAGGCLSTGNFHDLDDRGINKVLNTILTAVGCTNAEGGPVEDFGDSSLEGGQVDELLV